MVRALLALFASTACILPTFADPPLRTVAERSGYTETSKHEDVLAFCAELAAFRPDRVWSTDYGTSKLGQKLPLLVLGSGGKPITPADARASGKLILFAFANIHAGEVDGKEALLALARDLSAEWDQPKWSRVILLLAPDINPDGNDKMDKRNRTDQNGPPAVGTRENADRFDLNRDFVKLETPEIRAIAQVCTEWDPRIVIDCHTTNGSYHRYTLTYDGPRYPAAHPELIDYTVNQLLPHAGKMVTKATGFETFWYGNFDGTHTKWETYPAGPRFGVQWLALRGRFGILSESYSYSPFSDRVKASYAFVKSLFEYGSQHADEIRKVTDIAAGPQEKIALQSKTIANQEKVNVLGYVEQVQDGRKRPTAQLKEYPCSLYLKMEPEATANRPYAYLIPQHLSTVAQNLQRHGIIVEELLEDIQLTVQPYVVESHKFEPRAFQKHKLSTVGVQAQPVSKRTVASGMYVVKTEQPLGQLASYLLEPAAEDGLTTWNFFDEGMQIGKEFPVLRVVESTPMLTGPAAALPEKTPAPAAITFDVAARIPQVGRQAFRDVTWLDADHFLQTKGDVLMKVDARTGDGEPYTTPAKIKASLSAIEKISAETVDQISKSTNFRFTPDKKGFLFDIGSDPAMGFFDGTPGFKLSTGGKPREFGSFNADGSAYAFVSLGNLYAIDVKSKVMTQLTNDGGKNEILNGRGDWVYDEEIFLRNGKAYWWSPDGKSIAYMRFDDNPVGKFAITDFSPTKGKLELWNYPKSGGANPLVKLGVVARTGGETQWLDLGEYNPADIVISRVGFMPNNTPYCYIQNRTQTWLDFLVWPDLKGKPVKLFRDQTKAWIDDQGEPKFLSDGSFLHYSERSGYKHLYHYATDGKLLKAITTGEWEAKTIVRVDEKEGFVYFNGTKDGFTRSHFYRVSMENGTVERLSPLEHAYPCRWPLRDRSFRHYLVRQRQTADTALRGDRRVVRQLDSNPARDRGQVRMNRTDRVQIPLADGFVLKRFAHIPEQLRGQGNIPSGCRRMPDTRSDDPRWLERPDGGFGTYSMRGSSFPCRPPPPPRSASGKVAIAHWACYSSWASRNSEIKKQSAGWPRKVTWTKSTLASVATATAVTCRATR
ncbi:MAG: DPP IV N-terminal domain-containing protein [Gemmataceae bacterium]